ncbi:DUF6520 family protein [Dawidia soli]|uniref:DUF6520 family protein n=1 Tax=Dawidia soli TaxID=2782352 RepID=UPI003742C285
MNIKNVVLGIVSLVLATGSAFASTSMATPEFINVLYVGDTDWVCTKVPTCSPGTTFDCRVQVPTVSGPVVTNVYDNNTPPTTCSLRRKTDIIIIIIIIKPKIIAGARNITS